ncbi:TonB-dependent receptor plug domain-containing protein [Spirosoma agri]|uniref:TonB-dependent receptor plug domain-containing protein n=1 Tax=Spirosoma agri TaxID=1987381 RepID=A0A6M0IQ22_9BACT|nr:TonB-dependent receptor plug domain-containing protein [Spirosoma agri]NEU70007.1 TonB-dependent receptor plug domain-containing protein [Spirosoma agri]
MVNRICLVLASLLLVATGQIATAQMSCDESVAVPQAEKRYATGNFDDVFSLLLPCSQSGSFTVNGRVQALKILSMSYLAIDSMQQSAQAISQLLALNPKFEPDYLASPRYKTLFQQVRDSQEEIIQVTSVSKKAENLLYVPATVMVISSRDFVQRGYQSLEQVLHDLPGFDVIKGNGPGYSNFYQRGYRSTSNDRTLMLIDGVEENDLASSNIPISQQYALSDIDRVEVIYGPASTMYGANAFAGVINIITKSFRNLSGPARQLAFTGQARTGALNTTYFDGVLTAKTPDVAISVTTRLYRSDEIDLSKYPEWNFNSRTAADYTGQLDITGADATKQYVDKTNLLGQYPNSNLFTVNYDPAGVATGIRLTQQGAERAANIDNNLFGKTLNDQPVRFNDSSFDWSVRAKVEFKDLTISLLNWKTDEGATPWYTNRSTLSAAKNPRWVTNNRAFSITYSKYISDKFQLTNITSYLLHEINGNSSLVTYNGYYNGKLGLLELAKDSVPKSIITYYYRISTQLRNELRLFWTPVSNVEVNSGLEFRSGLIQGNYITSSKPLPDETGLVATGSGAVLGGNNFQTLDLSLYSQVTYRPRKELKVVGGLRVDNNRIRTNGGYGTVANPRLAVIYSPGKYVFKGIYAEAFKDASFLQKYATTSTRTLTNPNLLPERVRNIEFSAYYQVTKQVSMNVVSYMADYSDAVGVAIVPLEGGRTTQQFQAIGRRRIWGIQGEGNYRVNRLNAWWNFTYTNPIDPESNKRVSDIADYMINAGGHYQFLPKLSLYLSGNYVSARKSGMGTSGSNNPTQRFDPFLLLNSNLTYSNLVNGLSVQLSAANLLNNEYFVPGIREADNTTYASRFPQARRQVSIALLYTFKLSDSSR